MKEDPAEGLRQEIEELCNKYGYFMGVAYDDTGGGIQAYPRGKVIDELVAFVTAYAATVEREARKDELHLLAKEHADICGAVIGKPSRDDCTLPQQLTDRLAALQGAPDEAEGKA